MKAMGASRGLHWCVGNCVRRIREGGKTWHHVVGGRDAGRWTTLGHPTKELATIRNTVRLLWKVATEWGGARSHTGSRA